MMTTCAASVGCLTAALDSACDLFKRPYEHRPRHRPRAVSYKRVRRFERPTFTLATCEDTEPALSTDPITCGPGKGVAHTATTPLQDEP